MAGPYPPRPPVGGEGQPFAGAPAYSEPYPYPSGYPGPLPPPVSYPASVPSTPTPPARRALLWGLLGLGLIAALVATAVLAGGRSRGAGAGGFTDAAAKTAIQGYLNALSEGDTEAIARNTLCGMYDSIRDRKSDMALARLASDAFRKQFVQVEVTAIDTIVLSSPYQAQVLFTMKVQPAATSRKARDEEQGVAQLLRQGDQLLVCSYLLRTAAQY